MNLNTNTHFVAWFGANSLIGEGRVVFRNTLEALPEKVSDEERADVERIIARKPEEQRGRVRWEMANSLGYLADEPESSEGTSVEKKDSEPKEGEEKSESKKENVSSDSVAKKTAQNMNEKMEEKGFRAKHPVVTSAAYGALVPAIVGYAAQVNNAVQTSNIAAAVPGLVPAGAMGLIGGVGATALYGIGRWNTKRWDLEKAGALRTMWRGVWGIPGIPLSYLRRPYRAFRGFVSRQAEGVKRLATGQSAAWKVITVPTRKTWGFVRGLGWKGFYNGITRSGLSEKDKQDGFLGKVGRAVPYAAARVIRSPWDIGKYLLGSKN